MVDGICAKDKKITLLYVHSTTETSITSVHFFKAPYCMHLMVAILILEHYYVRRLSNRQKINLHVPFSSAESLHIDSYEVPVKTRISTNEGSAKGTMSKL